MQIEPNSQSRLSVPKMQFQSSCFRSELSLESTDLVLISVQSRELYSKPVFLALRFDIVQLHLLEFHLTLSLPSPLPLCLSGSIVPKL